MDDEPLVTTYDEYIAECSRYAFQAFSPKRLTEDLLDDSSDLDTDTPAARQKPRFRGVIRTEIGEFKVAYQDQFRVLHDAVAADEPASAFLDDYLAEDPFYAGVAEDRREDYREATREDVEAIAEAIEPLVGTDDVWSSVTASFARDEAVERLLRWFDRPDYIGAFADDVALTLDATSVSFLPLDVIDYSLEAIRLLDEGRDYLERVIEADVAAAYGDDEPLSGVP